MRFRESPPSLPRQLLLLATTRVAAAWTLLLATVPKQPRTDLLLPRHHYAKALHKLVSTTITILVAEYDILQAAIRRDTFSRLD